VPTDRAIDSAIASAAAKEAAGSIGLRVQADSRDAIRSAVCRAVLAEVSCRSATVERAMFGHHLRRGFVGP